MSNLRRGHASFLLFDHSDDLRLGKTAFPHVVCSFKGWADSTSDRGNFRGAGHAPDQRRLPALRVDPVRCFGTPGRRRWIDGLSSGIGLTG